MSFEYDIQRVLRQIRPGILGVNSNPTRNLLGVIEDLKANPKWLKQMQSEGQEFLAFKNYVPALTESGLMVGTGFFTEMLRKIEYKFLPKAAEDDDFLAWLGRTFDMIGGSEWTERLDVDVLAQFLTLLFPEAEKILTEAGPQLFQALEILGLRLAYFGVEDEVYSRLKERPDFQHAFLNLQRDLQMMLDGKGAENIRAVYSHLELCRDAAIYIRSKRSREGISLGLTFQLMRIQELVKRMQGILNLLDAVLGKWNSRPLARLLKETMVNESKRFELRAFIGRHTQLLAYQITEHTGRAGEHYITTTRSEYRDMFRSASIGGAIVAFMVLAKAELALLPLAPGAQALSYSLLYASGFLFLHTMGGTLASKQPAMTASRIAAALDEATTSEQALLNLTEMIIRTIRSQLIALLGNYLIAFPVAFAVCVPFAIYHLPLVPHAKAEHLLTELHPWKSLSLLYAAMAGVCLFVSGLIAGAADNWFVFNRVGKRLENSPLLRRMVRSHNLKRAISFIENNIGFWTGNISLGFFLGSAGTIGAVFGLPIDIRHVTFSSGQIGVSLAHLSGTVPWSDIALISATVFVIGLINLATSFSLTLYITMRSRGIRFRQSRQLFRLVLGRLLRRPTDFFYPPAELPSRVA